MSHRPKIGLMGTVFENRKRFSSRKSFDVACCDARPITSADASAVNSHGARARKGHVVLRISCAVEAY